MGPQHNLRVNCYRISRSGSPKGISFIPFGFAPVVARAKPKGIKEDHYLFANMKSKLTIKFAYLPTDFAEEARK